MLKKDAKIFVAGHRGLVGSSIVAKLQEKGYTNIITRTRQELDLQDQVAVHAFLAEEKPDWVVVAAAKVGGIHANNTYPADFIGLNLGIQQNIIWGSHMADVPNLCFLGSSCVYPRETKQPIPEDALLTDKPEPTNAPYAIAKIAGMYLCDALNKQYGRNYFTAMPPNVYGANDNFDLKTSHVLPALIRKFHEALPDKPVECWGTGSPKREFLINHQVADGIVFLMEQVRVTGHVNVGTGKSISIKDLAELVQKIVGHKGEIVWNTQYPDGFPEKTMDTTKINTMGWHPSQPIEEGIAEAYAWFRDVKVPQLV